MITKFGDPTNRTTGAAMAVITVMDPINRTTAAAMAVVTAIAIPLLLVLIQRRHSNIQKTKKKMPPCLPLGWIETTRNVASAQGIWFLAKWAKEIGYVYRMRIPQPHNVFCVGDPVLAREILQDPTTTKPKAFYGTLDEATGASNIFSSNGERWRHARKAVTPAFASTHIKRMNQVCKEKLEVWIEQRLNVVCQTGEPIEAAEEMILLTLSIIAEAAFEYNLTPTEAALFVQELDLAIREFLVRRGSNPFRQTWLGYVFDAEVIRRALLASQNIQGLAQNILDTYRSRQAKDTSRNTSSKGTVIEYIVKNPNYKDDKERIADILVFLVGGHDTTAYTIAWTLLELARNPPAMKHVRNELVSITCDEERSKCPALDHVIKEAMRLHPVAAIYLKEVHRDFLVHDDTVIPKGSVVFLMNILMHRNPQYFDNPDEFHPERWETKAKHMAFAFAPFSHGARNCVGQALANAELHTVLARLIADYDFEVVDPGKAECTLTLKPSGLQLKATSSKKRN